MLGSCISVVPKPGGRVQSTFFSFFFLKSLPGDSVWITLGWSLAICVTWTGGAHPCGIYLCTNISPGSYYGFMGWGGVEVPCDAGRRAWVSWQGLKWTAVTLLPHTSVALRNVMREIIPIGRAVSGTLVCPFRMEGEVAWGSFHGLLGSGK